MRSTTFSRWISKAFAGVTVLVAVASGFAAPPAAADNADLVLILDVSGSMWGQIGGENKIVIARRAVKELLGALPADSQVGLVAYGHRSESDCKDIETVKTLGPLDAAALGKSVDALTPKGKTPITASIEHAVGVVRAPGADATSADAASTATVVLVSDGLETCGGDPCKAVKTARASGRPFVLHVVGFDLGKDDASSLECAAQAGGGLYFDARDAAGLASALDQAVASVEEIPAGRLSVKAVADGKPVDATVHVLDAGAEQVAFGRTYVAAETNPRVLPLADGTYQAEVRPVAIRGAAPRVFDVTIAANTVEKIADWSSGELAIAVTRNGALSDATVTIFPKGEREQAAAGRTYAKADSNPKTWKLAAGDYDVEIASVEISGKPSHRLESVTVEPNGRVERKHEFQSGTLSIGAVRGAEKVDATVTIASAGGGGGGKNVDAARTYTAAASNPKQFLLAPGRYQVTVTPVKADLGKARSIEVDVAAGATVEKTVDFGG